MDGRNKTFDATKLLPKCQITSAPICYNESGSVALAFTVHICTVFHLTRKMMFAYLDADNDFRNFWAYIISIQKDFSIDPK